MKILLATGIFPPQIGGPATYAKLLSDELPRRGIDVEVASFSDYLDKPISHGGLALSRFTASIAILVFIVLCILIFPQRAAESSH